MQSGNRRSSSQSLRSGQSVMRAATSRRRDACWSAGAQSPVPALPPPAPAASTRTSRRSNGSGTGGAPAAFSRLRSARLWNITCRGRRHEPRAAHPPSVGSSAFSRIASVTRTLRFVARSSHSTDTSRRQSADWPSVCHRCARPPAYPPYDRLITIPAHAFSPNIFS